jgi:hypothetical protein
MWDARNYRKPTFGDSVIGAMPDASFSTRRISIIEYLMNRWLSRTGWSKPSLVRRLIVSTLQLQREANALREMSPCEASEKFRMPST